MESRDFVTYDVFRRSCPSHTVLEVLSNKWLYLAMMALRSGRHRFTDLQRRLEGVSPKMLTQTLRGLERDGLIVREVFPVVPPRVEYELTPLGREFARLLGQICDWAIANVPEILEARERYAGREK
ncbi:winged helix-turn-helix transcriptional regulator [Pseudodonghicola flavimaris]|uniref:Helix-turn-helix domain-containing protein n=1 Tax=Pseudodonghicola flavimaris TaxID=3050036 RepID=A0ABT7F010_9RHOB|nr:helix-turn-helix domain-containing protein [Pseudodonghicola flavimaris]MDK3017943.1 helix-turn-helix domain-containing protein [Pseudodonghicola flavimaris]